MARTAKKTDLTRGPKGDPTDRADVSELLGDGLEGVGICFRTGKVSGEVTARTQPRSALGTAVAAVLLALGGCVIATVMTLVIGTPEWVSCCGLLVPVAIYLGVRLTSRRPSAPERR